MRRIDLENGKYTYVFEDSGQQYALRHGESWRDLTGDKFVFCLAYRVHELEKEVAELRAQLADDDRDQMLPYQQVIADVLAAERHLRATAPGPVQSVALRRGGVRYLCTDHDGNRWEYQPPAGWMILEGGSGGPVRGRDAHVIYMDDNEDYLS